MPAGLVSLFRQGWMLYELIPTCQSTGSCHSSNGLLRLSLMQKSRHGFRRSQNGGMNEGPVDGLWLTLVRPRHLIAFRSDRKQCRSSKSHSSVAKKRARLHGRSRRTNGRPARHPSRSQKRLAIEVSRQPALAAGRSLGKDGAMMQTPNPTDRRRFRAEPISHAVWLCHVRLRQAKRGAAA